MFDNFLICWSPVARLCVFLASHNFVPGDPFDICLLDFYLFVPRDSGAVSLRDSQNEPSKLT